MKINALEFRSPGYSVMLDINVVIKDYIDLNICRNQDILCSTPDAWHAI